MTKITQVDVAVVGGGPAGSLLAERLAAGGARVVVFDHSHPREKVCAGGISARARAMFPELEELVPQGKTGTELRLVSPGGHRARVRGKGRTFAIDRTILDKALLDRAVQAGAEWRQQKVLSFEKSAEGYVVQTAHRVMGARIIVGADGVHSLVRRHFAGAIAREHLALGAHVLVEDFAAPSALIRFLGDRRGYAWVFNRRDRASIGVGMPQSHKDDWLEQLANFFAAQVLDRTMPRIQGWTLPQASTAEFFRAPVAGDDWLLIGDAAGHVDPLSGEGIWYALWGAALAAEAILAGRPVDFDRRWREAYLARFEKHIKQAAYLTKPRLLDAAILAAKLPAVGGLLFNKLAGS
ncbi:MAG: NAD(P)/FAD-dependent oxidoreductase [Candidatus Lernaella stagnicola]|nr:NAD(P)/FAD-dependent oxidoreductase [Candidatus Lernaella stagnicola]